MVDNDVTGYYPRILRQLKDAELEKEKRVLISMCGQKGMGMTYYGLRIAEITDQQRRTREGNLQVETTRKPKSG